MHSAEALTGSWGWLRRRLLPNPRMHPTGR
jgi:hypothetical protein